MPILAGSIPAEGAVQSTANIPSGPAAAGATVYLQALELTAAGPLLTGSVELNLE